MSQKPSISKGTRDLLPSDVIKRNYIFDCIRRAFRLHGFLPIETPSFELSSTLMGKYGEEGDRLIFRILNSGEKMKKADLLALQENNLPKFANSLSEKALRYDLTVPFARFVVQHQNSLTFPFKRYQIQPVWRADRPQHGRYQEFFQCDGDVVGSDSLWHEVDLMHVIDEVLTELQLPGFTLKLNNRKVLAGVAEICGETQRIVDITVSLDKLDKIGEDGVVQELRDKGFTETTISKITPLFNLSGDFDARMNHLKSFLSASPVGLEGLGELQFIYDKIKQFPLQKGEVALDVTLARGLNYYTGAILEVQAHGVQMGSICGGGRYDDLTALFGLKGLSGVGISFGADRIFDIMETLQLFPAALNSDLALLFLNFGEVEADVCQSLCMQIRKIGLSSEVYPTNAKIQKQMKYANDRKVTYVAIFGEDELNQGVITLRNMADGKQETIALSQFISRFQSDSAQRIQ